jgi:hypothetical protein
MDTQLVAEKLFKFCKEKYPDLKWDIKSARKDSTFIYGSDSFIELTLGVHKECEFEYILGSSKISSPMLWLGTFHVWMNFEKNSDIDFTLYETDKIWNEKDWVLSKQSRKIMLNIFNFILDEIQE